jgi:succinate-acetate transporter protein
VNRAKTIVVLGWLLIVVGLFNLVLAIVDISQGASLVNNILSLLLSFVFIAAGIIQVMSKGARQG